MSTFMKRQYFINHNFGRKKVFGEILSSQPRFYFLNVTDKKVGIPQKLGK